MRQNYQSADNVQR